MENKSLHIAMFGHKHMLSREGGIEIVVRELATRMAQCGHQVVVYDRRTRHVSNEHIDYVNEFKNVKIIPVCAIERKGLAAMTSSFFAAIKASRSCADIIHIHAEGPAAMCGLVKLLKKNKQKKIIVTIHGLDWARAKWGKFASKYIKWGEKQAVIFADEIIVLSRNVQEYFQKEYGRKTVYIPNGVIKPKIRDSTEIKKLWGLEKDSYVIFLGRIVPEKGLVYLIEAWKQIRTDKTLVITGGSSDTDTFMQELKTHAGANVLFTGFQQNLVLEELFSNAYIYCLPSDLEGMPLSLLEAMSYGNCCLVSDIPECVDVVEDKAVTFKHGSVNDLQEKLQLLLNSPQIVKKYKDMSAEYIVNKYNWKDVVDKTLKLYQS